MTTLHFVIYLKKCPFRFKYNRTIGNVWISHFYYHKTLHEMAINAMSFTSYSAITCSYCQRPRGLILVSSVFLGQHGCESRQVLVHRCVCNWAEVVPHVTGQGDEHTVREQLQRGQRLVTNN